MAELTEEQFKRMTREEKDALLLAVINRKLPELPKFPEIPEFPQFPWVPEAEKLTISAQKPHENPSKFRQIVEIFRGLQAKRRDL